MGRKDLWYGFNFITTIIYLFITCVIKMNKKEFNRNK